MAQSMPKYVLLAGAFLLAVLLFGEIPFRAPEFAHWDLFRYQAMAEAFPDIDPEVKLPFAGRLLGPALVAALPVPVETSFRLWTLVAGLATTLLLCRFLERRGIRTETAVLVTVLFVFNRQFFGTVLWNYFQLNDMLGFVCLLAAFEAMLARRWTFFALALAVGVFAREIVLVMVPTAICYLACPGEEDNRSRRWPAAILSMVPTLVIFVLLRNTLPESGRGVVETFRDFSVKAGAWRTWYYLLVNSVSPLTFLPVLFHRRALRFLADRPWLVVYAALVFVSSFMGSNNERLMAPVFVAFYWLVAHVIDGWAGRWRTLAMGLVLAFTLTGSVHHTVTRFGFVTREAMMAGTLGSLLALSLILILFRIRRTLET